MVGSIQQFGLLSGIGEPVSPSLNSLPKRIAYSSSRSLAAISIHRHHSSKDVFQTGKLIRQPKMAVVLLCRLVGIISKTIRKIRRVVWQTIAHHSSYIFANLLAIRSIRQTMSAIWQLTLGIFSSFQPGFSQLSGERIRPASLGITLRRPFFIPQLMNNQQG